MNKVIGNGRGSVEKPFLNDADINALGANGTVTNGGVNPNPNVSTGAASAPTGIVSESDGRLIVHEEAPDAISTGEELGGPNARVRFRWPDRLEWIKAAFARSFTSNMLVVKAPGAMEKQYFFVDQKLRDRIDAELKHVRIIPIYSLAGGHISLWPVEIPPPTGKNEWFDRLGKLLRKPPEFFPDKKLRVYWDHASKIYRVKVLPDSTPVAWPEKDTRELAGEALGEEAFVRTEDHPIFTDLVAGTELL